jgi:biotin synthase
MGGRVLRHTEAVTTRHPILAPGASRTVGVSAGTAAVLGLHRLRQTDAPTTAYLMVGEHCVRNCAFCAQARQSTSRAHYLSRVVWPLYPLDAVVTAVAQAFERHDIQRCCLQVTAAAGCFFETVNLVDRLRSSSDIPISASIVVSGLEEARALVEHGVDRVTLALDAACDRVYREAKGGGWRRFLDWLQEAAACFPGRIGTHLIVGLGESEREMALMLQKMIDWQVGIGLFAFTPVRGTAWGERPAPRLAAYRRIQAARYLMALGVCRAESLSFSSSGQITSYGLSAGRLRDLLRNGRAFETAGCAGCNRPYYNERPGGLMYNYPRPLTAVEAAVAMTATGLGELLVGHSGPELAGLASTVGGADALC